MSADGQGVSLAVMVRRLNNVLINVLLIGGLLIGIMPARTPAHAQQDSCLSYGTIVRGHISAATTEETWRFNGHTGDLVLIDMRAIDSGLDVALTLLGPEGIQLAADDDGGPGFNARIGPFTLPANGDYTILAGQYSGEGDYTLDLRNLRTIPTLAPRKPLVGSVNMDDPNDAFVLALPVDSAGETLWQLNLSTTSTADYAGPMLMLYDAAGLINSTESQPSAYVLDPIIPLPDAQYIVIVSWNTGSSAADYEIVLRPSTLDLLIEGASQSGTLDTMTTSQTHYFRAEAGQIVRIVVRTRDDIAPALDIRSLDYSTYLYFSEGDHTRELQVTLNIPLTTVYSITVRDGSFAGNQGEYVLDFELIRE
ncbi:MAG: hypothetical protein JXA10_05870 [Anaerolineae bacterium]|nr:hypothetical protein [Anaerolineae bacterium]